MLEVKDLSIKYSNGDETIKNLSFKVDRGELILLTGESGSGKTSIINTINGLLTRYNNCTYTGEVLIDGKNIKEMEMYQISMMISSVFQNPKTYFFNVDTTTELLFYLENIGLKKEEMENRLKEVLDIFPIKHLLDRDIFKLSGGEKQILCIAASYISGNDYIILDEPSSNLDHKYTIIISEMLKLLKEKGKTLIIAEHRLYYLMDIVDKVIFIKEGKIKKEYSIKEFLELDEKVLEKYGLRTREYEKLRISDNLIEGELEIEKLYYSFLKKDKGIKLENVKFKLGKIYAIIGRNGCGKSTFVQCLIGVNKKSDDKVIFNGKSIAKKERLKLSNLVMQDVNHQLFTESVIDEVVLGIKNIEQTKVEDVLMKLGLVDFKNKHPMSLSGGQKQRVAIASVILSNRRFIFLDEPTSGMDYKNMLRISNTIKEVSNKDNIVFIISHDNEFINRTADYIIDIEKYNF